MNIQTRIKKLEELKSFQQIEGLCGCYPAHWEAVVNQAYGESFNKEDILVNDVTDDLCRKCKRPIPKDVKKLLKDLVRSYGGNE